jgi:RimJ/RimL family protein N-acetyltransferase
MALDRQPRLAGKLVELRPATAEDFDALFAVASDPLIWEVHPAHDRWQEPVFRRFFADGLASGGMLVAIDRASGAVIGSSRYDSERAEPGEVEIGWTFLARSHWGGRYNGEMKRLMLDHAFGSVDRAIFLIGDTNIRSRRAIEKIGGRLTDRAHRAEMAGVPVVHVIYAIDRPGSGS